MPLLINPSWTTTELQTELAKYVIGDQITITQPQITGLNTLSAATYTSQFKINDLYINGNQRDELISNIALLNAELTRLIDEFKKPQYNHLRLKEFKNILNQYMAPVTAAYANAPVAPDVNADTWYAAFNQAIKDATTNLRAVTPTTPAVAAIFTPWGTDVSTKIAAINSGFYANVEFTAYGIPQSEYSQLVVANEKYDALIAALISSIATEAAKAEPDWSSIATPTLSPTDVSLINEELIDTVINKFTRAASQLVVTTNQISRSEYTAFKQLIDGNHHINAIDVAKVFMTIDRQYDGVSQLQGFVADYISNNKFNIEFILGQDTAVTDITVVTLDIKITSTENPAKTFTKSINLTINNASTARQLYNDLNAQHLTIFVDPTKFPSTPTTMLGDITSWDRNAIWVGNHMALTQIQQILSRYPLVHPTWEVDKDASNHWVLRGTITDDDGTPLRVEYPLTVFSGYDRVRDYFATQNPFGGVVVYPSESANPEFTRHRIVTQQVIDTVNSMLQSGETWDVNDANNLHIEWVSGVPYVVINIPSAIQNTPLRIRLNVSPYGSPSQEVTWPNRPLRGGDSNIIHSAKNDAHGVGATRDPQGEIETYMQFNPGDQLTHDQLIENFPTIFGMPSDTNFPNIIARMKDFGVQITSDGMVTDENGVPVVTFVVTDTTINGGSYRITKAVNYPIVTQDLIDTAIVGINHEADLIRQSIEIWDGPQEVKDLANEKLNGVLQHLDQVALPALQAMIGKPAPKLGLAAQKIKELLDDSLNNIQWNGETYNIPKAQDLEIPKDMTLPSKILMITTAAMAGVGGIAALGNAATIATTNKKLKKNDSTMKIKAKKTGFLSLSVALILVTTSVLMFVYLFVEQGGL